MSKSTLVEAIKMLLRDPVVFADRGGGIRLRQYQVDVCRAVVDSVIHRRGLSIVVIFPRQSGKNELQAQIEAYLLTLLSERDAEIVKVSPTWKPQSINAMRRLERIFTRNVLTRSLWSKESGYIYRIGRARIFFLSGAPESNIVGATASTLLEVDEAQDVLPAKYDKDIAPMAASTNATRVFWGTAWTGRTLLARELRQAQEAERREGGRFYRRVFRLSAEDVGREVPEYAAFVAEQVAKLGRNHPMVRTQFFSEEIDAQGGMFPPERIALIWGDAEGDHKTGDRLGRHGDAVKEGPEAGKVYAMMLDVAGEEESIQQEMNNTGRDSTALTIVEVDLSTLADLLMKAPTYRVVARRLWTGVKHSRIYGEVRGLAELWGARYVVVDATGVGAGLASFLDKALPGRVIPFVFNQSSKSELGWGFLGVVDSGRWKEWVHSPQPTGNSEREENCEKPMTVNTQTADCEPRTVNSSLPTVDRGLSTVYSHLSSLFLNQLIHCQYEVLPGPARIMRWGVPDGTRDAETGELVHDDLVISAALCVVLDGQEWSISGPAAVVRREDPLREYDRGF